MIPASALPSLLRTRDADDVYTRLEPLVRELRETVGTIPGVAITARWMPGRLVVDVEVYDVGTVGGQVVARLRGGPLRDVAMATRPVRLVDVLPGQTRRVVLECAGSIDRQGSLVTIRQLGDVEPYPPAERPREPFPDVTAEEAQRLGREGLPLRAANANDPTVFTAYHRGRAEYDVRGPSGRLGS